MNHILHTHTVDITVRSCSSTTFAPFKTCNNANINEKGDRGAWYIEHWADIFFSERPQAIEGYDLAIEDAYTMQQLCAYEVSCLCIFCHDSMNVLQTAAIASSPNSLLKKKDLTMHEYSDTLIFVATHLTMSIWNRFNDLPTVSCSSDHTVHRGC